MARRRELPGRISRAYAWALFAVHPAVPVAWIALLVAATLTLPSLGSAGSAPLEDLVAKDSPALIAQERSAELFGAPLATDTVVVQRDPYLQGATAWDAYAGYLKQLTYQRATREATRVQAGPVVTIADFEQMPGHRDSAQLRLDLIASPTQAD